MTCNLGGRCAVSQSNSVDEICLTNNSETKFVKPNFCLTIGDHHEFLRQCINNDAILDFLRFCNPKIEIYSEQTMPSFQLKILKQEINRAEKGRKVFKEKLETDRSKYKWEGVIRTDAFCC